MSTLTRRADRIVPVIQTFYIVFAFFHVIQQFLLRDLHSRTHCTENVCTHFVLGELVLCRLIQLRFVEISEGLDLGTFRL